MCFRSKMFLLRMAVNHLFRYYLFARVRDKKIIQPNKNADREDFPYPHVLICK